MKYLSLPDLSALRFDSAGQFVAIDGPIHPRRLLDTHVLLLGCSGTYPIAVDGVEYLLRENTFLLLPAGIEHTGTAPASDDQSHLWCHFTLPGTQHLQQPAEGAETLLLPEYGTITQRETYTILFHQLINGAYRRYKNPASMERITKGYLTVLLAELADECSVGKGAEGSMALVRKVEEYIRLHACEGIRPTDVASYFHYNSDYLTALLRAATGYSLVESITLRKLEAAKKLLLDTESSVHDIAHQVGFEDSKYFMKLFRRWEKVTPSEFRQLWSYLHLNRE